MPSLFDAWLEGTLLLGVLEDPHNFGQRFWGGWYNPPKPEASTPAKGHRSTQGLPLSWSFLLLAFFFLPAGGPWRLRAWPPPPWHHTATLVSSPAWAWCNMYVLFSLKPWPQLLRSLLASLWMLAEAFCLLSQLRACPRCLLRHKPFPKVEKAFVFKATWLPTLYIIQPTFISVTASTLTLVKDFCSD